MGLKQLTIQDRRTIESFLGLRRHALSVYAFPGIFGWKRLFRIRWEVRRSSLCVYFTDGAGSFLYLPPLGEGFDERVVEGCFRTLDALNARGAASRIENVEEADLPAFKKLGYAPVFKSHDYVYSLPALAGLQGDRYKAKRASVNHFVKHNRFQCRPYAEEYRRQCLFLYREWMTGRAAAHREAAYCGMLSDSLNCLETVLESAGRLGVQGQVVLIGGRIAAFTLGYRLNEETLCVLFEIADLRIKGLSQFIFRSFCQANEKDFRLVNAMDDSGLENLKGVKRSYRPLTLVPAYIVNRRA